MIGMTPGDKEVAAKHEQAPSPIVTVSTSPNKATPKKTANIIFVATMVLVRADPMCCVAAKSMVRAKQTLKFLRWR